MPKAMQAEAIAQWRRSDRTAHSKPVYIFLLDIRSFYVTLYMQNVSRETFLNVNPLPWTPLLLIRVSRVRFPGGSPF